MALPMKQYSVNKQVQDHFKPVYDELYKKLRATFTGALGGTILRPMLSDSEEQREANFERIWDLGGFSFLSAPQHGLSAFLTRPCSKQLPGSPPRQGQ